MFNKLKLFSEDTKTKDASFKPKEKKDNQHNQNRQSFPPIKKKIQKKTRETDINSRINNNLQGIIKSFLVKS